MTQQRQIIIGAVVAVLVAVLFFFVLLKPKLNSISKTRDDIQSAQDEQSSLQTQLAHLKDVQRRAPEIEAKIQHIEQYLPDNPDLPGFIRLVQSAATASGIDLQSIAPSPPSALTTSPGVSVISVTLTIQGGFFRVEDFLSRLEGLQRAVEVRALALSPIETDLSNEVSLTSTVTLQMYTASATARATGGTTTTRPTPTPSATATP